MTSQNPSALSGNTSIRNHPFIWGNIAFLAGVPWLLVLSMAGLAVGDPVFPAWLEIFLLGFPAIAAVVWLQWQQPFSPFSLWFLVKPSESLSDDERRVLTLVKQQRNGWYVTGWVAIAVAFVISAIFCKLYIAAPLAQAIAPFPAGLRLFGIIWAEICFLLSNVLLQSGISALRIKLTDESEIASLQPLAVEKIKNNFTHIGWQVPQLLKFFEKAPIAETVAEKDALQESISEQPQDVVEESQDAEISDAVEEPVDESSPEVVESTSETKEVVSEEELIAEDDAIAVQEESNISEFEVDALVKVTTETEVNLDEELTIEEPNQLDSEVVADFHNNSLGTIDEETSEESEIDGSIEEISELETFGDVDDDDFREPTSEEAEQVEFGEPKTEAILDITEDVPKSESHEVVEEAFDTSSDISDIKLDTQETANYFTEDSLDLSINDTAAELEIDKLSDSTDEEIDVNLDNPFADITEELASDNFDEDTNEKITDSSDSELEIVEPELKEIASFTDNPNAETSEIVEESSISEITEESDHAIDLEPVDVATGESVKNTEELAINEIGDFTPEVSDDVSAESAIGTNLDINANLLDTQSIEDQSSEETNALEINEPSQESESEEIIDFADNSVDSAFDEIVESDEGPIDALEIVDDAITETEINDSVETDLAAEAKSQKSKKSIDLFRKPRKKGFSQKIYGFGKSAKPSITNETDTNQLEASVEADDELEIGDIVSEESVESRFDIADTNLELEEIVEEPNNTLVSEIETNVQADLTIGQVETLEGKSSDFDEELDELIAFNAYVENILQDYLGDSSEEADDEKQEVEDIIEISSVSEQAIEIAEEVLMDEEILETAIPELMEILVESEPELEAIAQDSQETTSENNPEHKDPKYLVQEFLLDKFLAKLEEMNNADKSNKTNTDGNETTPEITTDSYSSDDSKSEVDEFADLEALLNRKPLSDNPE